MPPWSAKPRRACWSTGSWSSSRKRDRLALAQALAPIDALAYEGSHVAPWRSVYKLHSFTDAEQTFVLTAGGHNVGIVNPPGHAKSSYRMRTWRHGDRLLTPDEWLQATQPVEDTWWTAWRHWLERHSTRQVAPPSMGSPAQGLKPLDAAPGRYVRER